jgi:hypothetical protein
VRTWEASDPDSGRPVAAPLDRCAGLLGVDLATIRERSCLPALAEHANR